MNVVGAVVSTKVAKTVGSGIIAAPKGNAGLVVVFAALVGAITWNLITWYFGLPSSSSHALIGGLIGAALASAGSVKWAGVYEKVVIPMVLSPLIGFLLAFLFMLAVLWLFRRGRPSPLNKGFRIAQIFSSGAMAYGHGLQDAQKTMGVITLALFTTGHIDSFAVPVWVIVSAAAAISLGPTPVAGGSCGRWGAGSSTSPRPLASPPRPWRPRCSTRRRTCTPSRSRRRMSSPRR